MSDTKYIVVDWANNDCLSSPIFNSFDDANEWLDEQVANQLPDDHKDDERESYLLKDEYWIRDYNDYKETKL